MGRKVVIVGAGPGGLAAGMLLAHGGFDVHIYEKQAQVGGRNGTIEVDGYTFDIGPTFLQLPSIVHDLFESTGRKVADYMDLRRLDPMYRLRFPGGKDFLPTDDLERTIAEVERVFPGEGENYRRFMQREGEKFDRVYPCLAVPYDSVLSYLKPRFLRALPRLDAIRSVYHRLSQYFGNEHLRHAMTFQSKYLGMSPWQCPATFTILSYIEHKYGIWHPIGGLNAISRSMAKVIEECGGRIHLSSPVREVMVQDGEAKGVVLADGEVVSADFTIVNADFAHAMTTLVQPAARKRWTNEKLDRCGYSCSTFMLYLGVDKTYDIPHHNILFADDYRLNVQQIAETGELPADPSVYVQNACVTDPSLAPEGKSTIYLLVPIANKQVGRIDWEKEKHAFRDRVLEIVMRKSELKDLAEHIEVERMITPDDWQKMGVYNGATFNLAHNIGQMLYFRPHNRFEDIRRCFIVGGGTHPGSGIPTILQSGVISAHLLTADAGQDPRVLTGVEVPKVLPKPAAAA